MKGRKRNQARGTQNSNGYRGNGKYVLPLTKSPQEIRTWSEEIVPPEMDIKLRQIILTSNSGAGTTSVSRFNPNSAYQPIPGGATASVPGFSEMATFYGFYRVIAYEYKATFANLESFPVSVYCINSNNDPSTTGSVTLSANALSQNFLLAPKGGGKDTHTFTKFVRIADLLGSDAIESADSYRALINAAPADITWLGLGSQSGTGANITLGTTVMVTLTMYVRFYDRLLQS